MAESSSSQISGDFTLVDSSSNLNGVIFHNVQTVYTADEAVHCVYSIIDEIEPELSDFIGLFKVGWTSSTECFSSVPAMVPPNDEKQFLKSIFGAHLLPNDSSELYQFCYVSKMRVVGASTPFTFEGSDIIAVEDPSDPGLLVFKSRVSQLKDELHKLSEEKIYYASKHRLLHNNFMKLKCEFDRLEQELLVEKETSRRLEEANNTLKNLLENADDQSEVLDPVEPESEVLELDVPMRFKSEEVDSIFWKFLCDIKEVATDINLSMESQETGVVQMSYKDFVSYVLEVFTNAKLRFQMKEIEDIDESKYCKCYFQQKASCCPSLCSEALFKYILTQPLYTCFSNFYHYSEDGGKYCDGTFDHNSLTNYVKAIVQNKMIGSMNVAFPEGASVEENSEPDSEMKNIVLETKTKLKADDIFQISDPSCDVLSQMNEEREKVNNELKLSRERIASLNSRVNVLELELVAQQSSHLLKSESVNERSGQIFVPSSSVNTLDVESILECVHNEYIDLKDKYRELSKKIAKMYSLEAKCSALEEENAKLIEYFKQVKDQNKACDSSSTHFCDELEKIIGEKTKVENKLISLQKESVGKISINLVQHKNEE
ncbi:tax1-binding protein 1 homolog [Halyomorpha halys]|uniref:tax1-binding protein 1 homolog n=1 Tax=Halyomorpha halys TaxID=286706 RepID=UPI0006D4F60A|nr:tax1-binding protein 1 homolog [Halyomorpha halys]